MHVNFPFEILQLCLDDRGHLHVRGALGRRVEQALVGSVGRGDLFQALSAAPLEPVDDFALPRVQRAKKLDRGFVVVCALRDRADEQTRALRTHLRRARTRHIIQD